MIAHRWRMAIRAAIPSTLLVGTLLMYPLWSHRDLRIDSPVFPTEAQAREWVRGVDANEGAACLDWARETKVIDQGYGAGSFVQYRCNTDRALWRVGFGYAIPAFLVLAMATFLSRPGAKPQAAGKKKKK